MNRTPVDSSNVHSHGHDETGLEVQFHADDCARRRSIGKGERYGTAGVCNCKGGDVFHYAGFPAEKYAELAAAPSFGSHFMKHVRGAKHPETGQPLYPHVKRTE